MTVDKRLKCPKLSVFIFGNLYKSYVWNFSISRPNACPILFLKTRISSKELILDVKDGGNFINNFLRLSTLSLQVPFVQLSMIFFVSILSNAISYLTFLIPSIVWGASTKMAGSDSIVSLIIAAR